MTWDAAAWDGRPVEGSLILDCGTRRLVIESMSVNRISDGAFEHLPRPADASDLLWLATGEPPTLAEDEHGGSIRA